MCKMHDKKKKQYVKLRKMHKILMLTVDFVRIIAYNV